MLTSLTVPGETSATPEAALLPFEQRWLINGTLHVIPRARHINEFLNASDIMSLLFFSDNSPDGLVRALDHLPMGLIASSTPFFNGHPFTLFFNDEVHSSGAVGVALRTPTFPEPTICFGGLEPLAAGLGVVTVGIDVSISYTNIFTCAHRSEGDLIRQINGSNAAQVLIDPVATAGRRIAKRMMYIYGPPKVDEFTDPGPSPRFIALDMEEGVKTKTSLEAYTQERYHTSLIYPHFLSAYSINSADSDPKAYTRAEEPEDELPKKIFQVLKPTDLVDEDDGSMDVIRSSDSDCNYYTACPPAQDVETELLGAHLVWFIQNDA
ncbi:hypothetical protein BU17DRAFT_101032 [Hysterangium stoloniferum]|nr:hypothetical protein BU17DRAFT_101032 [Hysterangium stoloniferum]